VAAISSTASGSWPKRAYSLNVQQSYRTAIRRREVVLRAATPVERHTDVIEDIAERLELRRQIDRSEPSVDKIMGRMGPASIDIITASDRALDALKEINDAMKELWSCPTLMDGLGLRRVWLGHDVSFRIRWAKDSPGPSGGVRDCRSLR
jgi:hypothetical protein